MQQYFKLHLSKHNEAADVNEGAHYLTTLWTKNRMQLKRCQNLNLE